MRTAIHYADSSRAAETSGDSSSTRPWFADPPIPSFRPLPLAVDRASSRSRVRGDLDRRRRSGRERPGGEVPHRPAQPGRAVGTVHQRQLRRRTDVVPDAAKFHYYFGRATFRHPRVARRVQRRHLLHPDKRYIAGSCTRTTSTGRAEPVYGVQFYPQDVIRESWSSRRQRGPRPRSRSRAPGSPSSRPARSRPPTTVADELAGARRRGAAARPDPRRDPVPAAQRR